MENPPLLTWHEPFFLGSLSLVSPLFAYRTIGVTVLSVAAPGGHVRPRLSGDRLQELSGESAGSSIAMLCPAQAFPHPDFR